MTSRKLSIGTQFSFGIGESAGAFLNMAWGVTLLFFYQQVVGVEASWVGLAIAISMMVDAITDPLIGTWSDRIRTRWGRRHPMLLFSAIPLSLSFYLLFSPPDDLTNLQGFIWLTVFAVLVRVSYTFYNIPHLSLGAEMVSDYEDRSKLFAYQAFISAMSVAVSYGLITAYYFPTTEEFDPGFLNPEPYNAMAFAYPCVMIAAILLCVMGTKNQIPHLRNTQVRERFTVTTIFREMAAVLKNRSFLAVFLGLLFSAVISGIEGAFTPFLGIHFWGFTTEDLYHLTYVGLFVFPIAFYLTPALTRLLDKRMAVIIPLACWILAVNIPITLRLLDVSWYPSNESDWVLIIFISASCIGALAAPIIGASINSMLADIADEIELDTGLRREGVIYAFRAFSGKATGAIGITLGGFLLSAIEFPTNASRGSIPDDMVWNLGFIAGPGTSIFSLIALGFYLMYRIDHSRHAEILKALEIKRQKETIDSQDTASGTLDR